MNLWQYAGSILEGIRPAIPKLSYLIFLFLLAVFGIKIIDHFSSKMKNKFGDKNQLKLFSSFVQLIFLLVIIIMMLSQMGVTQDFLKLLGLIITGIVAFSSTSLITNLVSGFIIHITRPFYAGDIIKINDVMGKVVYVKSVYTEIYTFKKTVVHVPNSSFIGGNVVNYSKEGFRISVIVSLGYDINRVDAERELLKSAASVGLEDVFVSITKLDNYFVSYEINGTCKEAEGVPFIESRLNKVILDKFSIAGIEIASPSIISHRTVAGKILSKIGKRGRKIIKKQENLEQSAVKKIIKDTFGKKNRKKLQLTNQKVRKI